MPRRRRRGAVAVAQPARLGALQAQPAGLLCRWSLFVAMLVAAACSPSSFSNDRPLVARYEGEWFFPIVQQPARRRAFGGDFETPTDWHDPFIREQFAQAGQLGAVHAQPATAATRVNYFAKAPSPAPPTRDNWLGTDERGPRHAGAAALRLSRQRLVRLALTVVGVAARHR